MSGGELPPGAYLAPARSAEAEVSDRGSRFLAIVRPVTGEAAARRELDELARRLADASHCCWAWRLGRDGSPRSSDAGEPAGTAGMPILRAIEGAELSDVLVVVARWFGGTKLGKGGLARAYSAAARQALARVSIDRRIPSGRLTVDVAYPLVGAIKRLLRPPEIDLEAEEYGESARLVLRVADHRRAEIESALAELRVEIG